MDLPVRFHTIAVMALLLVAGVSAAEESGHDDASVYYVRHAISSGLDAGDEVSQSGYYRATLQSSPRGAPQVLLAPLWTQRVDAAGTSHYLLDLEPGKDDRLLDVLQDGFVAQVTQEGESGPLRPVDQKAWSALAKKAPAEAEMLLAGYQAPGLRPVVLPRTVAVGDSINSWQRIEPYASFKAKLRVLEVTPTAVLMDMTMAAAGVQGDGRLVVQRADGMPIELRMEVSHAATRTAPASLHRVHLADTRHDLMLHMAEDLQSYVGYVEQINHQLQHPPFSNPSPDASAYTQQSAALGELEQYMVGAGALPALEPYMGSLWIPAEDGSGRWLAIGARAAAAVRPGARRVQHEPVLMSRLHGVELLDARGAPIAGLEAQTVTRTLFFPEKYSAAQNELNFPFHLPLGAPRALLGQIEAVRMSVDAEVYAFETSETLAAGEHSTLNPDATVLWPAAHRVTLVQGRQTWKEKTGLYSVVVPLDEDGNEMPSEQLIVAPLKPAQPTRLAEVPLAWENSKIPIRTEIATGRPIARLQVRHYRWSSVPRTWIFPMYP
jgi:hypothetical protein